MKIAIFATNSKENYSGGRYHSLVIAECLASKGHEVYYITNNKPVFYKDFECYETHRDIKLTITDNFKTDLQNSKYDFVFITPHQNTDPYYYNVAKKFARETEANLVLINFESPNWFNKYSPVKRDESKWAQWLKCCEEGCLILSSAKESMKYAKEYYTSNQKNVYFDYWYPTINSKVADEIKLGKEKRIVVLTRLSDKHKGSDDILELFDEKFRGYTLVFILGVGNIEKKYLNKLEFLKRKYNINYELKYKLSDKGKFEEIKKAEIMLFPSYFEGFGYPPVEAQYCGTKCIAYELPVLKESSKDGIVYSELGNIEKFKETIKANLGLEYSSDELKENIFNVANFYKRADLLEEVLLRHKAGKIPFKSKKKLITSENKIKKESVKVRVKNKIKKIASKRANKLENKITYYPKFDNEKDLSNHYYRAAWYLPNVDGMCKIISIFSKGFKKYNVGERPEYMGQATQDTTHIKVKKGYISYLKSLIDSKIVLQWCEKDSVTIKVLKALGVKVININTNNEDAKEYGVYPSIYWKYLLSDMERKILIQENFDRFNLIAEKIIEKDYNKACVFGTGPSLETAKDYDFKDCLTIVCNSVVQNEKLLNHISPEFICAGDAVSHIGVSTYAEKFRKDLIDKLKNTDIYMLTTATIGYILMLNHPEIREKLILIEQTVDGPNYNLLSKFGLPKLDSTLNIHMLPIANTFVDEIFILGCDGKSKVRDNEDFWAHAKGAQYDELVDTGHICHPTFDINRQKSTYNRHLDSVHQSISIGENEFDKRYHTLNQSNIEALVEKKIPDEWVEVNNRLMEFPNKENNESVSTREIECKQGISNVEHYSNNILFVKGWVLSLPKIDKIKIFAEDKLIGNAMTGVFRSDLKKKYPEYDIEDSGFVYTGKIDKNDLGVNVCVEFYSNKKMISKTKVKVKYLDKNK